MVAFMVALHALRTTPHHTTYYTPATETVVVQEVTIKVTCLSTSEGTSSCSNMISLCCRRNHLIPALTSNALTEPDPLRSTSTVVGCAQVVWCLNTREE